MPDSKGVRWSWCWRQNKTIPHHFRPAWGSRDKRRAWNPMQAAPQAFRLGFFPAAGVAICLALCHNAGLPLPGQRAAVAAVKCSCSTLTKIDAQLSLELKRAAPGTPACDVVFWSEAVSWPKLGEPNAQVEDEVG